MQNSNFVLPIQVPQLIRFQDQSWSREEFFARLWEIFGPLGLVGIHEGTLLTEEAFEEGLSTQDWIADWVVDSAEAPADRDWVSQKKEGLADLYFDTLEGAKHAAQKLASVSDLHLLEIREEVHQDWDALWKDSFRNSEGLRIAPFWQIAPAWGLSTEPGAESTVTPEAQQVIIKINPGAGFGTGTHETTQLCLRALGEFAQVKSLKNTRILDFGSGSGILAIGAALLGSTVDAVEVDTMAIANATENAELNGMSGQISFATTLTSQPVPQYQVILANILRPVLLQFLPELLARLVPEGVLIMSGLIELDLPYFISHPLLVPLVMEGKLRMETHGLGEWYSIVVSKAG